VSARIDTSSVGLVSSGLHVATSIGRTSRKTLLTVDVMGLVSSAGSRPESIGPARSCSSAATSPPDVGRAAEEQRHDLQLRQPRIGRERVLEVTECAAELDVDGIGLSRAARIPTPGARFDRDVEIRLELLRIEEVHRAGQHTIAILAEEELAALDANVARNLRPIGGAADVEVRARLDPRSVRVDERRHRRHDLDVERQRYRRRRR
jgi:hypothetical protein